MAKISAKEFQKLAWRANKRLYRLEQYAKRPEYEGITGMGGYRRAQRDILSWRGEGHTRFDTKMPDNPDIARAVLNDMRAFLRSDTSTVKKGIGTKGAASKYQSIANKFNKTKNTKGKCGDDLTWKEIQAWYTSYNGKKVARLYKDSKAVAMALGEFKRIMRENPKKTLTDFRNELKNNPKLIWSDDDSANEAMKRMIKMNVSPKNLFKQR